MVRRSGTSPERGPRRGVTRRTLFRGVGAAAGASLLGAACSDGGGGLLGDPVASSGSGAPAWPSSSAWDELRRRVGGRLVEPVSPLRPCISDAGSEACSLALRDLENPFFHAGDPGSTQSTGWLDAWTSQVSPYAVAADSAEDIAAAVDFARDNGLRLVVRGMGHDYLGRNTAADSLLIWTRNMADVTVHDAFVPDGAPAGTVPVRALSVGAGTAWLEAYGAATRAGLYVQGGGCTSVGASGGFIQGSGFGSFSKRFGTGAGGVVEFEVVTADGRIRVVNAHRDPDLFWALRGGGGSTFGVVARTTLLAHPIPSIAGTLAGEIRAVDGAAFRDVVDAFVRFYPAIDTPSWGEQVRFRPDDTIELAMTFLDLEADEARAQWEPFLAPLRSDPRIEVDVSFDAFAFEHLWDLEWWERNDPDFVTVDPRADQPPGQYWWSGNQGEVSAFWHSYHSRWVPRALFDSDPDRLVDMLVEASRIRHFTFQINKGLSGEHPEARARDLTTSLHPSAFDAAGLIIMASAEQYAYPGVDGHEPDLAAARRGRDEVERAMAVVRRALPGQGAYANEADYFTEDWQEQFWGANYPRLLEVKERYDPERLFRVHHGVGSEG